MARVTVEDCLQHVANRFELIMLATRRTRQLLDGATPLVRAKNKMPIMALREIAAGKVHFEHPAPTAAPAVQPGSKKGDDKA